MRRPNRSIEVLDISLMAVVTKAMGAFLVLMVVFMQYYSSGPIGQNTADQLTKEIEQTQKNTVEALKRLLEKANPEDIAKLLEEARRRLEEARKLIDQLKRENSALNAQADRLQRENAAQEREIEELEKKLAQEKIVVTGHLINWDCMDTEFTLGFVTTNMFLNLPNGGREKYVLNHNPSLGDINYAGETDFRRAHPNSTAAPGTNFRFNVSWFRYVGDPGTYGLIVAKYHPIAQTIRGFAGRPLKRTAQDCNVIISIQSSLPGKKQFSMYLPVRVGIAKDSYAETIYDVRLDPKDGALNLFPASQATEAWLKDQIANAAKVSP